MIEKKEDNIRSESYYPDSNYYLDQDNSPKEFQMQKIKYLIRLNLNGQIATGLLLKEQMEDLQ